MFKFGRFRSNFDVYTATRSSKQEVASDGISSVNGAYRMSRNEFSMPGKYSETQEKVSVAAPRQPQNPPQQIAVSNRQPKSSNQSVKNRVAPPPPPPPSSGVSLNPQGPSEPSRSITEPVRAKSEPSIRAAVATSSKGPTADPNSQRQLDAYKRVEKKRLEEQKKLEKKRLDEQKKLEKKRLEEQKKSQKLALQEQAKQEKLRKEREKKEAQQLKKNKKQAPQRPLTNPLAQGTSQAPSNPPAQSGAAPHSTNTLNSSISKTSGPPPYSDVPQPERKETETNSNVQLSKPVETDSWDLVAKHRQNVSASKSANTTQPAKGQTTMDLNFSSGESKSNA